MAGGIWKAQNKRRPGVYINVKGNGKPITTSSIGRLLMFQNKPLGWGENGVITLDATSDYESKTGHNLNDPELAPVKEALKGAETVLLVNKFDGGKKASYDFVSNTEELKLDKGTVGVEAKHPGTQGNKLTVDIVPEITDQTVNLTIKTIFGTKIVDEIKTSFSKYGYDSFLPTFDQLTLGNKYIKFIFSDKAKDSFEIIRGGDYNGTPPFAQNIMTLFTNQEKSVPLTGGEDGTNKVVDSMNEALENEFYAVATTAGWDEDSNIHQLFAEQIKRLRENIGLKVRGVVPNSKDIAYNYEGISGVKNGYKLNDGTIIDVPTATARFAGMSASANAGTALTYADIDDAIEASPRLNNEETIDALNAGEIVFTTRPGQRVVVEQDINTLTKWSGEKPKEFSKNRIIRTLDDICTDTQQVFETSFLGKVGNDNAGRNLFKANRTSYLEGLQSQSIIQNFKPEDLEVLPGEDSDAVLMNLSVQPVDAMEKLYVTITVR